MDLMEEAVSISRESGPSFTGPWALGALAMTTDDPAVRQRALSEAEQMLRDGCVSHNYFRLYRDGMDTCLKTGDWDGVERYAAALEDYTRSEPLPWADFFAARGRSLAAYGRGGRDETVMQELERVRGEADRVGFCLARQELDAALGR
jgi:hypothetical protein